MNMHDFISLIDVYHWQEAERKQEEERIRMENIIKGNPLINQERAEFKVKRRSVTNWIIPIA